MGKVRNFEKEKLEIWGKIETWKNCKFGKVWKSGKIWKFGKINGSLERFWKF